MGSLYSRQSHGESDKNYMSVNQQRGTVLRAVEDIAKLTYEEMEQEFDHIYKSSNHMLRTFTEDPCQQLSSRIIACLNENAMQMSKCFDVMDQYRSCVSSHMSEKLVDVVDEFERSERLQAQTGAELPK